MAPMSRDEADDLLRPHLPAVVAPIRHAWGTWEELAPAQRRACRPTTRANWIYDHTIDCAKVTLDRGPAITYTEQPGFLAVTIEDRVLLRYKKLDEDLGICGIKTDQFQMWEHQEPISGIPALTNVVAGHTVDEFGRLGAIHLVCSYGGSVLWTIEVPGASDQGFGSGAPVSPIIPPQSDPPATKIRPAAAEETNDAEQG